MYFINSICTMWPSCESFVTALPSPLDGPSPSHLGPGSPARIPSGFFHPSQQRKGNLHSVTQSEVPLVQAKVGVQGSWGVAALKKLGGVNVCFCVCEGGSCQLSRDLELASQLAALGQFLLLLKWGLRGLKAWILPGPGSAGPGSATHSGCGTQGASVDCHMHTTI